LAVHAAQGIEDRYVVADRYVRLYFLNASPQLRFLRPAKLAQSRIVVADLAFTCSTSTLSSFLALNGYTTYRYRYDASFPTTCICVNSGAYHTLEGPEVFGTYPTFNQFGTVTTQQIDLSAFMQKTWAGFAKNPADGVGWTRVGSAFEKELGLFGSNESSGMNVVNTLVADHPCALYAPIGDLLNLNYK
jgi:carboxylesterase type B